MPAGGNPFLAQIMLFAGNFAPRGWAFCEGQLLPISQYSALFSLVGTTYGGDGRTTFGLPDLRGRVAVEPGQGAGLSDYRLGQKGGSPQVTLQVSQMPAHAHTVTPACDGQARGLDTPANRVYGADPSSPPSGNYSSQQAKQMAAFASQSAGNGSPVDLMQPYLAVYYCICLQGVYPSRN